MRRVITQKRRTIPTVVGLLAAVLVGGCVSPGRIDSKMLARYQRQMSTRSPQPRAGEHGLRGLLPGPDSLAPPLKVVRDPGTGKAKILLTLSDAILRALANNVDIRVVSFDPQIAREDMVKAASAFDYTIFGSYSLTKTDEQVANVFGGGQSEKRVWNAGLRQTMITGGQWELAYTLTRAWDNSGFQTMSTQWYPTLSLQLTQPLLRDGWPEVNLATLRIARINHKVSQEAFRQKVEEIVSDVITQYWQLRQAIRDAEIQKRLLDDTIKTLKRVKARAELDATAVQIKQSEAAVASRRAALIRAQKNIVDVQDSLARLLADSQINILGDYELVPTTSPVDTKVQIDPTDQIMLALVNNPQLEQVRLGIAVSDIKVNVQKNQLLPKLDLVAGTTVQGLADSLHQSHQNMDRMDYISYNLEIQFEYPIGNRERMSQLRAARLDRLKTITNLQNLSDQVAIGVKERVREIRTTWKELQSQRLAVDAAKKELKALEDIEKIRGRLTPEFLQLKLSAQESVAIAERAELAALTSYNTAMADLAKATGTVLKQNNVKIVFRKVMDRMSKSVRAK